MSISRPGFTTNKQDTELLWWLWFNIGPDVHCSHSRDICANSMEFQKFKSNMPNMKKTWFNK